MAIRGSGLVRRHLSAGAGGLIRTRGVDARNVVVRTCVYCGHRGPFVREVDGNWYACSSCGRYA